LIKLTIHKNCLHKITKIDLLPLVCTVSTSCPYLGQFATLQAVYDQFFVWNVNFSVTPLNASSIISIQVHLLTIKTYLFIAYDPGGGT